MHIMPSTIMDVMRFLGIIWTLCLLTIVRAGPVVQTSSGPVEGYADHLTENIYLRVDRDIDVYLGIPFAESPTGRLRFANPEAKRSWEGVWNATYFRSICPQVLPGRRSGKDEDCLYLNVYVPQPTVLKPVMVWIHGGAYNAGAGGRDWYSGTPLAAFGDVIVVTINYRLGPFGFLSTGDGSAPGNFGMMDQIMSLQWVQDNIQNFGGDPSRVTLFGQSAGATSIGLHLISPLSQPLFQYAIMQSGSTLTPFAYTDDKARSREEAFQVGEKLGCRTTSSSALISCLRTKSTAQILASSLSLMTFLSAPVIDGVFLPDHPEVLVETGQFKRTNILIGTNHDEGTAWALSAFPRHINSNDKPHMDRDLYDVWHGRYTYGLTNDVILKSMDQEYLEWKEVDDPEADYLDAFVAEITDQTFVAPADKLSRAYATQNGGDVFLYQMTHVPSASVYEVTSRDIGPGWLGVTHGEDFQFVFGWSFMPDISDGRPPLPPAEKTFMADVMRYWINFAKTGNPNSSGKPNWSKFTLPDMDYLKLEPGFPSDRALRADTCNFWSSYITALVKVSEDVSSTGVSALAHRYHRPGHTSWSSSSRTMENIRRNHPQQWWWYER